MRVGSLGKRYGVEDRGWGLGVGVWGLSWVQAYLVDHLMKVLRGLPDDLALDIIPTVRGGGLR